MALQLWLPLNGNVNNEGLASAAMTVSGATVNTSGKIGSCYSFDGSDDYISIDCSELYKIFKGGSQQFTIAFWIYHADTTRAIIFGDYNLAGTIGFNIELTTGHQIRFYWNGSPDKKFAAATAIAASEWTHIVLTYDGSKINIYKNGILQLDSQSGTLATKNKTSGLFYLGRDSRTGATALNGKINDFRIYDTALSPREIKEISKGLVLHYTLSGPAPEQLFGEVIEDNAIYSIRQSPNKHGAYDSIVGASVGWNQIATELNSTNYISNGGISVTKSGDTSTLSITNSGSRLLYDKRRGSTPVILANHVVYAKIVNANTANLSTNYRFGYTLITSQSGTSYEMTTNRDYFLTRLTKGGACGVSIYFPSAVSGDSFICDGFQLFDLTTMLGSTIADRAQTLESSTVGAGVTWLKSCGFFADDYYSYDLGSIRSVEGLVKREVVGFNQWDEEWEPGRYDANGEKTSSSSWWRSKNKIQVLPNTTYNVTAIVDMVPVVFYDGSEAFISQSVITTRNNYLTLTTPVNARYMTFSVWYTAPKTVCVSLHWDGERNGEYEPYISHSYSFTNPPILRGVYKLDANNNIYADGDIWDSNGSVVRNYRNVVLNGTESWTEYTVSGVKWFYSNSLPEIIGIYSPITSIIGSVNRYVVSGVVSQSSQLSNFTDDKISIFQPSFSRIWVKDSTYTTVEELKASLTTNPITVIYKLATPTTETASKFTNPQIIEPYGTEAYSFTGLIPPGHITKYIDIEVEGGNYTYDESLENLGMTDNIEYDTSGFLHNGTKKGSGYSYISDTPRYQTCTVFSSITQHIYTALNTEGFKNSYSISLWLYYNSTQVNESPEIFGVPDGLYNCLFVRENILYWNTNDGAGNPFKNNGNTISMNNYKDSWHHFSVVGNGSTVILYIDGIETGRATSYKALQGTIIVLSDKNHTRNTFSFIGKASDFRVYATALSADDILELYHTPITLSSNGTLLTQGEYVEV